MVKGSKRAEITSDYILDKLSEYEIYRFYLGHDFKIGRVFHSPFRKDSNPSFSVSVTKAKRLAHTDFGDSSKKGGCVDFVMQMHPGFSYSDALSRIANDFNLSKSLRVNKIESISLLEEKRETLIQVITKKFDTADLAYWNLYGITGKELKQNDVYSVRRLFINRERIPFSPTELVFGYLFDDKWKIYRPLAEKKDKWLSNVPNTYINGLHKITNGCKNVVITKAKKDEMVLSKFLPYVLSVQNESEMSISKSNITMLTERCGSIFLNFDSDEVGVQACKYYNQFGFKWVNCPKGYKKPDNTAIKDFADLARYHGLDIVINHFKQKGII